MKNLTPLFFFALILLGCKLSDAPAPRLNASVRQSAYGITVTNGAALPYEEVTLKINYGLTGDYSTTLKIIKAGETVTAPYSDFTNSSNARFNYLTTKVEKVMVNARIGGHSTWEEFSISN